MYNCIKKKRIIEIVTFEVCDQDTIVERSGELGRVGYDVIAKAGRGYRTEQKKIVTFFPFSVYVCYIIR